MRFVIIVIFLASFLVTSTLFANSKIRYKNQNSSLIRWDSDSHGEWLDYKKWKREQDLKDISPQWKNVLREKRLTELVGRVVHCVGECRVYRGEGFANASFRSSILEGDEIATQAGSYAWIFLLDGTMVRLSAESSISLKEINIGESEFFFHARINYGNVLWLSRDVAKPAEVVARETDTLFLPMALFEANLFQDRTKRDEKNLFAFIDDSKGNLPQCRRLSKLIVENNKWVKRKKSSYAFLVMPNGTVSGKNLRSEFIVQTGESSYIKNRSFRFYNPSYEGSEGSVTGFFRGYENKGSDELENDQWYKVSPDGRSIDAYHDDGRFGIGEYLTKRIATVLVARELMLRKYSMSFFTTDMDRDFLAKQFGYRLWGYLGSEQKSDMDKRIDFLKEYTRRSETTNLLVATKLRKELKERGETISGMTYTSAVYSRALNDYITKRETTNSAGSDREVLNSTKRILWKKINAVK